ncbi:MAG: hypothetical protein H6696_07090 [Deferribacteres bacterium]|nr:hypothetical protein [candidate division KSB1 bacterium]MCB9501687.1 hypothetical protein [Deferribacteres bacterium]
MKKWTTVIAILLFSTFTTSPTWSQETKLPKDVRWVTDSAEYIGLCMQTYDLALAKIKIAAKKQTRPWAVVLDIDETVLNNVQYEVERVAEGQGFTSESWTGWVERREATAIPGVKKFLDNVRALGENAYVVFITNRDAPHEKATMDNLKKLGLWHERDVLLCRQSKSDTKEVRRREIMQASGRCAGLPRKNIIALFGDNLKDFYEVDASAGLENIRKNAMLDDRWGTQFFVLPNPMYGSWEREYK